MYSAKNAVAGLGAELGLYMRADIDVFTGGASGTKNGLFTTTICEVEFRKSGITSIFYELGFVVISPI